MWPKDYLNMCHIFYYNFSVNFLQSTCIRPQNIFQTKILVVTSLVNHHPVNIIISKDKGMLGQPGLSALSQWHDTIHLQKKGSEGVFVVCICDKALSTNYLT